MGFYITAVLLVVLNCVTGNWQALPLFLIGIACGSQWQVERYEAARLAELDSSNLWIRYRNNKKQWVTIERKTPPSFGSWKSSEKAQWEIKNRKEMAAIVYNDVLEGKWEGNVQSTNRYFEGDHPPKED